MTKRQKHALDFIKSFWAEHGYAPSYEEIKEHLGLKSKSNVHFLVFSPCEEGIDRCEAAHGSLNHRFGWEIGCVGNYLDSFGFDF